jgi:hypothetical protein
MQRQQHNNGKDNGNNNGKGQRQQQEQQQILRLRRSQRARTPSLRMTRLCSEGLGFAEFFGEFFAMFEGDDVEAVEDLEVDDEGDEGEGEEDGDHEPGTAESVA